MAELLPHPLAVKLADMILLAKTKKAATPGAGHFMRSDVIAVLQEGLAPTLEELEGLRTQVAGRKPAKAKGTRPSQLTDELYIVALESEPYLKGVDVRGQLAACQFWCKNNNAMCTKKRFARWLMKADRIITHPGGTTSTLKMDPYTEPIGWKQGSRPKQYSADVWANICERKWMDLSSDMRAEILKAINSN